MLAVVASGLLLVIPARAQETVSVVDVVQVKGLVDPALDDFVRGTIQSAEKDGRIVVLQIDSLGGYGDRAERLGEFLRQAKVPVITWVGPAGAPAQGGCPLRGC